jgi:hypothetical protein
MFGEALVWAFRTFVGGGWNGGKVFVLPWLWMGGSSIAQTPGPKTAGTVRELLFGFRWFPRRTRPLSQ